MLIGSGETVYEIVQSFDSNNNPISGVTFDKSFFINGQLNTGVTVNVSLSNPPTAAYQASFSSSTYGFHQFYLKNNTTNVIYVSNVYEVVPDSQINASPTIYIGL